MLSVFKLLLLVAGMLLCIQRSCSLLTPAFRSAPHGLTRRSPGSPGSPGSTRRYLNRILFEAAEVEDPGGGQGLVAHLPAEDFRAKHINTVRCYAAMGLCVCADVRL
jgi:hypothetical protein